MYIGHPSRYGALTPKCLPCENAPSHSIVEHAPFFLTKSDRSPRASRRIIFYIPNSPLLARSFWETLRILLPGPVSSQHHGDSAIWSDASANVTFFRIPSQNANPRGLSRSATIRISPTVIIVFGKIRRGDIISPIYASVADIGRASIIRNIPEAFIFTMIKKFFFRQM